MKLIFYLMIIYLINLQIPTIILSCLILMFLLKTIMSKPVLPKKLENKRNIKISILVPVYNEDENLDKFIQQIHNNHKNNYQVIFINDISTDSSLKILEEYQNKYNYKILNRDTKRGFVAGVLNDGFQETLKDNSNFIGVINSDCNLPSNLIDDISDYIEDHDLNIINLSNLPKEQINIWQRIASLEKSFQNSLFYNVDACLNNGYFISKDLLSSLNGWSETEITEDLDLALRIKKSNNHIYQSKLCVYDDVPKTIFSLFKQKYRWIKGDVVNRTSKMPVDLFEVIVNIYYIFPLYTLFSIISGLFLQNIMINQILILFTEGYIYYTYDSEKNIWKAVVYPFVQFIFAIYFYIKFMFAFTNVW